MDDEFSIDLELDTDEYADVSFSREGAALVIAAALELLAEVEVADEALIPDEVKAEAWRMRAVVDEHVERT